MVGSGVTGIPLLEKSRFEVAASHLLGGVQISELAFFGRMRAQRPEGSKFTTTEPLVLESELFSRRLPNPRRFGPGSTRGLPLSHQFR
jgi:hypothetical protein